MALVAIVIIADVEEPDFTEEAYKDIVEDTQGAGRVYDARFIRIAGDGTSTSLLRP